MNTGQMMITIGALFLLSLTILRVNRGFLTTDSVLLDSKLGVLAVSVGTSMIEEANGKAFDHNTDTTNANSLSDLSSKLGPESGETLKTFNDIDDFNGFRKVDNTMPAAEFIVFCEVDYISDSNPDKVLSSRSWNKKLTVHVTSSSMLGTDDKPDTLTMSSIYSYWYYR